MKHLLFTLTIFAFALQVSVAQSGPQGMKYQAVARDMDGNLLAQETLELAISLHTSADQIDNAYRETHSVTTNDLGLFTITIGAGNVTNGAFDKIPWESNDVFMAVSMYDNERSQFQLLSDSKLLAVPYAFHAYSAEKLTGDGTPMRGAFNTDSRSPWFTSGNDDILDFRHKLGTLNAADLVIITSGVERMRILKDGDIHTDRGSDVYLNGKLYSTDDVELNSYDGNTNIRGALTVDKTTTLMDNFLVENGSRSDLTGPLQVDGNTTLKSDFLVDNASLSRLTGDLTVDGASNLRSDLTVDGITNLESDLNVNNAAPTHLTGSLQVDGPSNLKTLAVNGPLTIEETLTVAGQAPTILTGTLNVDGETSLNNSLDLTHGSDDYIATFTNTNGGSGDGIKISLGRTHPRWNGSPIEIPLPGVGFLSDVSNLTKLQIKNLLTNPGNFSAANFTPIGERIVEELNEIGQNVDQFASAGCLLTNDVIANINGGIPLPIGFPALDVGYSIGHEIEHFVGGITDGLASALDDKVVVPGFTIPGIPMLSCPSGQPSLNFMMPNISLLSVGNSLTTENQFLQFTDKDDRQLGAVRAESIQNWCDRYLDLAYFMTVVNSFAGVTEISIDPVALSSTVVKYAINGITVMFNAVNAYNSIGVEYSSGFGDYAEWLERVDHAEQIHTGDIVGVIGGKITKDLTGAEQVMAVSFKPIVLGNTPPADREHLGSKIAFMGQIPVKVMGPVKTGDYIVGKSEVPGYGIAVHPEDMTPEDFRIAVGRSWAMDASTGPKMVNTVVGIHNGDYMHILKSYQQRLDQTESRLNNIEEKIDLLFPEVSTER